MQDPGCLAVCGKNQTEGHLHDRHPQGLPRNAPIARARKRACPMAVREKSFTLKYIRNQSQRVALTAVHKAGAPVLYAQAKSRNLHSCHA